MYLWTRHYGTGRNAAPESHRRDRLLPGWSIRDAPGVTRAALSFQPLQTDSVRMQIQDESYRDEDVLTVEPIECIDTEQVDLPDREQALQASISTGNLLGYALFGVLFGLILVKSEVVLWVRIQEMSRL